MPARHVLAALATTAVLLAGCATPTTPVDRFEAPGADVAGLHAFVWKGCDIAAPATAQDPALVERTQQGVRAAVTGELVRKGYVEVADAASADMLVSCQMVGQRRYVLSDERRIGAPSPNEIMTPGGRAPPPASAVPREQTIREGSVLVFADDARTGQLLWRGLAEVEMRVANNAAAMDRVVTMSRDIAATFPARRGGSP